MRPEILFPLFAPVGHLKGVGPRTAPLLEQHVGPRVRDLLSLKPASLISREPVQLVAAVPEAIQTFRVTIDAHQRPVRSGTPHKIRTFDGTGFLHLVFFKPPPGLETQHPVGSERVVSGRIERFGAEWQMAHPDYCLPSERAGEIPRFEPVYPATRGLTSRTLRKLMGTALDLAPNLNEWADPGLIQARGWPDWRTALVALHHPEADADLLPEAPARQRLAYDELLAHQIALQSHRRTRQSQPSTAYGPGPLSRAFEQALPWSLTNAQARTLAEIRADMGSSLRMNRLVQGDVGSGKTVVAALAMLDVAGSGAQAVLMAPTEILARQHYERLSAQLEPLGVTCVLLTGRDKGKARVHKLDAIADGTARLVFGTHAVFQDDVIYHRLGLAVIDEQHRFGVRERQRLCDKGDSVHVLSLSATPIPRSLALTQYGDLHLSSLDEKPPGRQPVTTAVLPLDRIGAVVARLKQAITKGTQAYWICPLVNETEELDLAAAEARVHDLSGALGLPVGLVHGQRPPAEKEATMQAFSRGEIAVLCATTVVEVGVDVPNATIMVIEHAERFGLAQLHQLRGRVGRGGGESACILLYGTPLSKAGRARLEVLRDTEDGFVIAERDWQLRGEGDLLGLKQSGFPAYQFADPLAHGDLLSIAARDAALILRQTPAQGSPRATALNQLVHLFDWPVAD